jgi:DNA-binding XRE family transcriptional regulator
MRTIRELRHERGWTQFELALKVGVQPQAIYLWETGRRTPQVMQLRKLGQIFEMCSDDIALVTPVDDEHLDYRPDVGRGQSEPVANRNRQGLVSTRGNSTRSSSGNDE